MRPTHVPAHYHAAHVHTQCDQRRASRRAGAHYHPAQVRSIGRHGQVVVAALDAATLQAWRELRVHVLDFTEFGDASDFRGIGADQAR